MDLLIDNCTLLQLVYSEGYSQQLVELANYVNEGNISLITHQLVLDEWETHKKRDKDRKVKKLIKPSSDIVSNDSNFLPSTIPNNITHLDNQFEDIDHLLARAKVLNTPNVITSEFAARYRDRLAPFHKKKDSLNDWEIIGSACHYCEINNIPQLFFASSNSNDFASDDKQAIHPDLQKRFSKVKINYYQDIGVFLRGLNTLVLPAKYLSYSVVKNEKYSHKASVKKNDLDSLYYLFTDTYREVSFIPTHLLVKYYPFSSATNSYCHFGIFSLSYVRDNLVELFKAVEVKGPGEINIINESNFFGIKDYQKKLEYVFLRLTSNLIFSLEAEKSREIVSVRYTDGVHCECVKCSYQRFDFLKSLKKLGEPHGTIEEKFKHAFFHYQFGNLNTAARLYLEIKIEALESNKFIIYYLCNYNLHHLASFLSNPFINVDLTDQELSTIKEIDPIEECVKLKSRTDYDLLTFIADGDFFKDALDAISELVSKIEDCYYSHLKGGASSNSFVWSLIKKFAELDTFINNNYVIYDNYSNFDRLFDLVLKGLFASHAMVDSANSALEDFDDYVISKIIFYGSKKAIFKYFNRYKLQNLKYKERGKSKGAFTDLASNMLSNERELKRVFAEVAENENARFYPKFNNVFDNLLSVATLLDLSQQELNKFANLLYQFIRTEKSLNHTGFESIASFINTKGKFLSRKLLNNLTAFFLNNINEYESGVLEALIQSYPDNTLISFDFEKILTRLRNKDRHSSKESEIVLLIAIYRKIVDNDKYKISETIQNLLTSQFDFRLFYLCVSQDVIQLDRKVLFKCLDDVQVTSQGPTLKAFFTGRPDEYNGRLDDLINVCFKFKINTKAKRFDRFRQINEYYTWLLDMEKFNYDNFNFNWPNHYQTKFYYEKMAKSKKLRKAIINFLRSNSHPELEQTLIRISFYTDI